MDPLYLKNMNSLISVRMFLIYVRAYMLPTVGPPGSSHNCNQDMIQFEHWNDKL